jgi:hypothetical protein
MGCSIENRLLMSGLFHKGEDGGGERPILLWVTVFWLGLLVTESLVVSRIFVYSSVEPSDMRVTNSVRWRSDSEVGG